MLYNIFYDCFTSKLITSNLFNIEPRLRPKNIVTVLGLKIQHSKLLEYHQLEYLTKRMLYESTGNSKIETLLSVYFVIKITSPNGVSGNS